jgi:hypothetical protein
MKPSNEVYVSTDVETDGPIPGPHSMLSFASAAYRSDKMLVGTFSANLETLPGASGHPGRPVFVAYPAGLVAPRGDARQLSMSLGSVEEGSHVEVMGSVGASRRNGTGQVSSEWRAAMACAPFGGYDYATWHQIQCSRTPWPCSG